MKQQTKDATPSPSKSELSEVESKIRQSHSNLASPSIPVKEADENNLQKLADLLESRGVRKYLNINNFGYSQIERDIVELLSPSPLPVKEGQEEVLEITPEIVLEMHRALVEFKKAFNSTENRNHRLFNACHLADDVLYKIKKQNSKL